MRFSVLIAAYRADRYIAKALESVRSQQHADWEIVVVEDGSNDQTESIVRQFAASVVQPVRYENFGTNRGVAAARTRLLELATGEAVAFIDADDWWTPSHLSRAQATFDAGADFVVARIQEYDLDADKSLEIYVPPSELFHDPVHSLFLTSPIRTSSCVALRRTLAQRVGYFDASLRIGEDRDYWLRCALTAAKFADNGEVTSFYSKHAQSTMARTLLWAEQAVAFYEKYETLTQIPLRLRRRLLAQQLNNYGRLVRKDDPRTSRQSFVRSFHLTPSARTFAYWLKSLLTRSHPHV
jgi:glycosyltransferase involved in cell wall biosynthesis